MRAWALAEWALVPLRLFLGLTFTYAGLQKLANPNFFNSDSPVSIQSQLLAAARVSPLHSVLSHVVQFAVPLGVVIAGGELAIGLGTLLGLWTRVAALGGALLSLSLFFTVSFHASPFYTGADIVFFFAWLPLVIAGGGSRLSLDGLIGARAAVMEDVGAPDLVAMPFVRVQELCGHFRAGHCAAREGLDCDAAQCPVLLGPRAPLVSRVRLDSVDRRALVLGGASVAMVGTAAAIAGAGAAAVGRLVGGAKAPVGVHQLGAPTAPPSASASASPTTTAPAQGTLLGPAKDVPVGSYAAFTIPGSGDPGLVVQPTRGQFVAFDAVCPHAGCTVGYYGATNVLACPCHGSQFNIETGAVLSGPAPHGLTKLQLLEGSDGNLYLK